MKAITTRYLPATDRKGARVVADDGDGNRIILPWRSAFTDEYNHAQAAMALCHKMEWCGVLQGGGILKAGRSVSMAWCWIDRRNQYTVTSD